MKLSEKVLVREGGGHDALAETGDGFGDDSNTLFLFRREEKWPQERAVDAVAKHEFGAAHALE